MPMPRHNPKAECRTGFGDLLQEVRMRRRMTYKFLREELNSFVAGNKYSVKDMEFYGLIPDPETIVIIAHVLSIDHVKLLDLAKADKIRLFTESITERYKQVEDKEMQRITDCLGKQF